MLHIVSVAGDPSGALDQGAAVENSEERGSFTLHGSLWVHDFAGFKQTIVIE